MTTYSTNRNLNDHELLKMVKILAGFFSELHSFAPVSLFGNAKPLCREHQSMQNSDLCLQQA